MSDYDDEMDARGQGHDLTTGDPSPARKIPIMEAIETMPLIDVLEAVITTARADRKQARTSTVYGDPRDDLF